jgi:hypothetical protein
MEKNAYLNTRISSSLPPLVLLSHCACERNRVQISTPGSHPAFLLWSCCWTVHAKGTEYKSQQQDLIQPSLSALVAGLCMHAGRNKLTACITFLSF